MSYLSIDFETASNCDLIKEGTYKYAQDASTRVLMMGWAFGDEPVEVWTPDQPFPQRVIEHVRYGGEIRAWNANFERLIWWYVLGPDYQLPEPLIEQFKCSAARARAHGLPGALADCARCLDLPLRKNAEGSRLIKAYCAPGHQKVIPPQDFQLFLDYCKRDVEVERQICTVLRDLTDYEWEDYWVNERINDRGVPVDVELARAAQAYGADVRAEVNDAINKLTFGVVTNARERASRGQWLRENLTPEQIAAIEEKGVIRFSETHREILLARDDLSPVVRTFTELVSEAGGSTIQKYQAFADRAIDGRLHGAFLFSGGGQTGRYSSIGLQLHNLRRDVFKDPQAVIDQILAKESIQHPAKALSRLIRSVISSPDKLYWVDYSNIEGRVAPWLEGSFLGEQKLQLFRDGVDPYIYNASQTFHVPMEQVTDEQRQAGKVQELALQFGGGIGALRKMGAPYGLEISDEYGRTLRDAWRMANPWMKSFSDALEVAAESAVLNPGKWWEAGRVAYAYDGTDWLWCRLPSGRLLAYLHPRLEEQEGPWGPRVALTVVWGGARPKVGEAWPRRALHGGLQIENCTQAVAADMLRQALKDCDAEGVEIVAHVHDEIVAQHTTEATLKRILVATPAWAKGLPIDVKTKSGVRYGK